MTDTSLSPGVITAGEMAFIVLVTIGLFFGCILAWKTRGSRIPK